MKRFIVFILLIVIFSACQNKEKEEVVISIGQIDFTREEFQAAFKDSFLYQPEGKSAKENFLANFLTKKLVLLEAERSGLDKNEEFLQDVQRYWERSLFKLALSRKAEKIKADTTVTDKEIKAYYNSHKEELGNKQLSAVYDSVKWLLLEKKQAETINQWLDGLHQQADIEIDYEAIGLENKSDG